MRVVLSAVGKFHTFELAREMANRDVLAAIFTGYPRFKLRQEREVQAQLRTFPWLYTPYMALRGRNLLKGRLLKQWDWANCLSFDAYTAWRMPPCDVYVGLSSAALWSGRQARQRGARFVCDRGSAHIRVQDRILREEHALWDMPYLGVDPRFIEREEAEYAAADCITVPSGFAVQSFIDQGVAPHKLRRLPYGVNLGSFARNGQAATDRFDVLFVGSMSLQKGIPYLLQAYKLLRHPRKSLSFAGSFDPAFIDAMKHRGLWSDDIVLLGHLPWEALGRRMSQSHALVLPSVQEGFGMVLAQALACGCPVIGSQHTGAPDLIEDGKAGYIVPIRNPQAIADRLQGLADDPALQQRLSQEALATVRHIGGWRNYGDQALAIYRELL
jgi:glycosyltransferase involved in cell wall biosynthesis